MLVIVGGVRVETLNVDSLEMVSQEPLSTLTLTFHPLNALIPAPGKVYWVCELGRPKFTHVVGAAAVAYSQMYCKLLPVAAIVHVASLPLQTERLVRLVENVGFITFEIVLDVLVFPQLTSVAVSVYVPDESPVKF